MAQEQMPHKLSLSDRTALTMTGVTEVVSFDENAVILKSFRLISTGAKKANSDKL